MGAKVVVDVEAVEAVPSSGLAWRVRVVQIRACPLGKCEARSVDTTRPSDGAQRVRGGIAV